MPSLVTTAVLSASRVLTRLGQSMRSPAQRSVFGAAMIVGPLAALVAVANQFFSVSAQLTTTNFLITLVAVVALGMFWGNSGILSLGHVGFMALGAYFGGALMLDSALKRTELPGLPEFVRDHALGLLPAVLLTLAFVAAVALVLGLPLLRMGGAAFVIASFGMLVIIFVVISAAKAITRGSQGFYGLSGSLSLWTAFACAAATIVAARMFRDSTLGLQLRASREDDLAARATGINVELRRLQAWVLSAMPAGVAGLLLGTLISAFSPQAFYLPLTITLVGMVIVGGLRTVAGAVVGTLVITLFIEVLRHLENGFSLGIVDVPSMFGATQIGVSVAILATLYLRPEGLVGTREPDEHVLGRLSFDRGKEPSANQVSLRNAGGLDVTGRSEMRIGAENVHKRFAGVSALKGVSIAVSRDEICGLIGPNGSGKTTLLNVLSGAVAPTAGTITLDGRPITGWNPHRIARAGIGRTFQNIRVFGGLTVLENVRVAVGEGASHQPARRRAGLGVSKRVRS